MACVCVQNMIIDGNEKKNQPKMQMAVDTSLLTVMLKCFTDAVLMKFITHLQC